VLLYRDLHAIQGVFYMDSVVNTDDVYAALLLAKQARWSGGPESPEGKYLALRLCDLCGIGGKYEGLENLGGSLLLSRALGRRAEQDLIRCEWICAGHFRPRLDSTGKHVLEHSCAMKHLIGCTDDGFGFALTGWMDKSLTAHNRLLMAVLLARADSFGYASLGTADLAKLMGFSKNQVKVQIQKLKDLGWLHGVVPGMSGRAPFRVVKTGYFLNLLHPDVVAFYPGLRAILLPPFPAWLGTSDQSILRNFRFNEFLGRPEVSAYIEHQVRMLTSNVLTEDWDGIGTPRKDLTEPLARAFHRRMFMDSARDDDLLASVGRLMALDAYQRAELIKSSLIEATLIEEEAVFTSVIRVLPRFSAVQQGVALLCAGFDRLPTIFQCGSDQPLAINATTRRDLILAGLLSDPHDVPSKYRSSMFRGFDSV